MNTLPLLYMALSNADIVTNLQALGALSVFIGLSSIGLGLIFSSKNPQDREKYMTAFQNVAIGSIIIGSALAIAGVLYGMQNSLVTDILKNPSAPGSIDPSNIKPTDGLNVLKDESNFILRIILAPFTLALEIIEKLIGGLLGLRDVGDLVFDTADNPFDDKEWAAVTYIYTRFVMLALPLLTLMVIKTGIAYNMFASKLSKIEETKEDFLRWIFSIVLVASGLLLIKLVFAFFNMLTDLLSAEMNAFGILPENLAALCAKYFGRTMLTSISTGNPIADIIVKIMFFGLIIKINIIFITRKIVLIVMTVFTPFAALLWGINKRVRAFDIWWGEIITNASMGFFYGINLFVYIAFQNFTNNVLLPHNLIMSIIWMSMVIKLSDILRNSLQGFFQNNSGINEEQVGMKGWGQGLGIATGLMGAMAASGIGSGKGFKDNMLAGLGKDPLGSNNDSGGGGGSSTTETTNTGGNTVPGINGSAGSNPLGDASGNGTPSGSLNPVSGGPGDGENSAGTESGEGGENPAGSAETSAGSGTSTNTGASGKGGSAKGEKVPTPEQQRLSEVIGQQNTDNKYKRMLMDNYNGLDKKNSERTAKLAKTAGFLLTGGDPSLKTTADAIGNSIAGGINGFKMNKAINTTAKQMATEFAHNDGKKFEDLDKNEKKQYTDRAKNELLGTASYNTHSGKYTKSLDKLRDSDGNLESDAAHQQRVADTTKANKQTQMRMVRNAIMGNDSSNDRLLMQSGYAHAYRQDMNSKRETYNESLKTNQNFNGWDDFNSMIDA